MRHNNTPEWAVPELSYRQLDYWTRRGWLHPDGGGGSGYAREWPTGERRVANAMARAVAAGIPPQVAHDTVRAPDSQLELAPGVVVTIRDPHPPPLVFTAPTDTNYLNSLKEHPLPCQEL